MSAVQSAGAAGDRFQSAAPEPARRPTLRNALLLAFAMLLVMLYRRPDQFFDPYVWAEDGVVNIPDFLAHGWGSLTHSIAGYYSVPIKLLNALAAQLSFRWYPEISFVLTLLASYGVAAAIAFTPTLLRWRFLCAIAVLLVPTDSEVFGVALLIGWWTSLLVLLPLYWNTESRSEVLRLCLLTIGALSSPLIVGAAPLYVLRAAVTRRRADIVTMIVALAFAVLQYLAIRHAGLIGDRPAGIDPGLVFEKFFGYYLAVTNNFAQSGLAVYLGLAFAAFLFVAWAIHRRELGLTFILLGGSLGAAIASAVLRIPIDVIHPTLVAARYFFFAYVLIGWILIQFASLDKAGLSLASCLLLTAGARNALDNARRHHAHLDWRAHVQACIASPTTYALPIHTHGAISQAWKLTLTPAQCAELVRRSLFDNRVGP